MWYVVIFLAELVWSYVASQSTMKIVQRDPVRTGIYDLFSCFISYEIIVLLAHENWNQGCIAAAVCGSALGTASVAYLHKHTELRERVRKHLHMKPMSKKKARKRIKIMKNVTTA